MLKDEPVAKLELVFSPEAKLRNYFKIIDVFIL